MRKRKKNLFIMLFFFAVILWMPGKVQPVEAAAASRQGIVDYAMQYVGKVPYVWGGNSFTTGMDCSGFVCGVFKQFGIDLWPYRTAIRNSPLVTNVGPDLSKAGVGDILWFEGHVGIYTGVVNGTHYMVNETTGTYNGITDNVIYSPVSICAAELKGVLKINQFLNDTTAPVIANAKVSNITKDGFVVTFNASDDAGIDRVEIAAFNADTGWVSGTELIPATNIGGNAWQFTYSDITKEGNYQADIYVYDCAGNRSYAFGPKVYIDRTAPVVSDVTVSDIVKDGFTTTITVADTNSSVAEVRVAVYDLSTGLIMGTELDYATYLGDNRWKYVLGGIDKAGDYRVDFYPSDAAGNRGKYVGESIYLDQTAPVISNIEVTEITKDSYTTTFIVTDSQAVKEVKITGRNQTTHSRFETKDAVLLGNDVWSYTFTNLDPGETYRITITASDIYGNTNIVDAEEVTMEEEVIVHTWDEGVVIRQPSEEQEGLKLYTCLICEETKTETIPKGKVETYRLVLKSGDSYTALENGEERVWEFRIVNSENEVQQITNLEFEYLTSEPSPVEINYERRYDQLRIKASDSLTGEVKVRFIGTVLENGEERQDDCQYTIKVVEKVETPETEPATEPATPETEPSIPETEPATQPIAPVTPSTPAVPSNPDTSVTPDKTEESVLKLVKTVKGKDYSITIAKTKVIGSGKSQKPKITVKYKGKKLKTKYYTVKYSSNKYTGLATVTVKGKGSYKSRIPSTKIQFVITPKKMKTPTVKAGKGTAKVSWKTEKNVTGYQIQISMNKKFKSGVQQIDMAAGKKSTTISKLTRKKTYYVRTRAYKKIQGSTFYGKWSSAKKVKIK